MHASCARPAAANMWRMGKLDKQSFTEARKAEKSWVGANGVELFQGLKKTIMRDKRILNTFLGLYLRRNSPTFTHNLGATLYSSFTTLSAASSNYAAFERGRRFFLAAPDDDDDGDGRRRR